MWVTDRVQSQHFPVKSDHLVNIVFITLVREAAGEFISKVIQCVGTTGVTNRQYIQPLLVKCDRLTVEVFVNASLLEADEKIIRKVGQ
jgi:hypothetical protein